MKTCPTCKQRMPINVKEVYLLCTEGRSLSEIARNYEISRQVVYAIKNKLIHKKITDEIDKKLKKKRLMLDEKS